ncbi:MAG: hypothetical protein ACHP84_17415 [Caulobacterales bacterium]
MRENMPLYIYWRWLNLPRQDRQLRHIGRVSKDCADGGRAVEALREIGIVVAAQALVACVIGVIVMKFAVG